MPQTDVITLTLASRNAGKKYELEQWIAQQGLPVRIALNEDAPEIEEDGQTFEENALLKARATAPVPGSRLVIGEDSGFGVFALDGLYGLEPFPGLYSNRWMTKAVRQVLLGIDSDEPVVQKHLSAGILKLMEGREDRRAAYFCGMTLWHEEEGLVFATTEMTDLLVIEEERGDKGFGYDPIVTPVILGNVSNRTMAELETHEKNLISHRGAAFRKLLEFLENTPGL